MTRDEARAMCIEAIEACYHTMELGYFVAFDAARILDSLHGIAVVMAIDDEMIKAGELGDLTNAPETKP
jgi:hypothetical protein